MAATQDADGAAGIDAAALQAAHARLVSQAQAAGSATAAWATQVEAALVTGQPSWSAMFTLLTAQQVQVQPAITGAVAASHAASALASASTALDAAPVVASIGETGERIAATQAQSQAAVAKLLQHMGAQYERQLPTSADERADTETQAQQRHAQLAARVDSLEASAAATLEWQTRAAEQAASQAAALNMLRTQLQDASTELQQDVEALQAGLRVQADELANLTRNSRSEHLAVTQLQDAAQHMQAQLSEHAAQIHELATSTSATEARKMINRMAEQVDRLEARMIASEGMVDQRVGKAEDEQERQAGVLEQIQSKQASLNLGIAQVKQQMAAAAAGPSAAAASEAQEASMRQLKLAIPVDNRRQLLRTAYAAGVLVDLLHTARTRDDSSASAARLQAQFADVLPQQQPQQQQARGKVPSAAALNAMLEQSFDALAADIQRQAHMLGEIDAQTAAGPQAPGAATRPSPPQPSASTRRVVSSSADSAARSGGWDSSGSSSGSDSELDQDAQRAAAPAHSGRQSSPPSPPMQAESSALVPPKPAAVQPFDRSAAMATAVVQVISAVDSALHVSGQQGEQHMASKHLLQFKQRLRKGLLSRLGVQSMRVFQPAPVVIAAPAPPETSTAVGRQRCVACDRPVPDMPGLLFPMADTDRMPTRPASGSVTSKPRSRSNSPPCASARPSTADLARSTKRLGGGFSPVGGADVRRARVGDWDSDEELPETGHIGVHWRAGKPKRAGLVRGLTQAQVSSIASHGWEQKSSRHTVEVSHGVRTPANGTVPLLPMTSDLQPSDIAALPRTARPHSASTQRAPLQLPSVAAAAQHAAQSSSTRRARPASAHVRRANKTAGVALAATAAATSALWD